MEKPIKKIIIINGSGGVGKDAFAKRVIEEALKLSKRIVPVENENYCVNPEIFYKINNISTIDYVKNIARMFGWNDEKSEKDRKMLSDLKDLITVYNDYQLLLQL